MHRNLKSLLVLLATGLPAAGCSQPEVQTTLVAERPHESADTYVVARIDASVLAEPRPGAEPVGTVLEGDLLTLLVQSGEFSKVNVRATGTTGWIDSNLCLHIPPNPYWEGDTNKAREAARRFYQDKFLVQRDAEGRIRFPVSRVKVESAFCTVTFHAAEGNPRQFLSRADAEVLGRHWIGPVLETFPEWREPVVYVRGFDGEAEFLMSIGPDKVIHFL
jgi:hypothetical protein